MYVARFLVPCSLQLHVRCLLHVFFVFGSLFKTSYSIFNIWPLDGLSHSLFVLNAAYMGPAPCCANMLAFLFVFSLTRMMFLLSPVSLLLLIGFSGQWIDYPACYLPLRLCIICFGDDELVDMYP